MMESNNIVRHFHAAVERVPHRIAIADKKAEITFQELEKRVFEQVETNRQQGLKAGDRVLVFVPMSIELYIHVLAIFHMGCTAVFLDEWSNIKRLKHACEIAQCDAFIGVKIAKFMGYFVGPIRKIPIWLSNHRAKKRNEQNPKIGFISPCAIDVNSETALITFTTGSTQVPKAAKRTHAFLDAQFDALQKTLKTNGQVVDMPVLPIVLLINLGEGVTSVIADWKSSKPDQLDPQKIVAQWNKYGVNRIISSPYFMDQMANFCADKSTYGNQIKEIFAGGAPVFPESAKSWLHAFPLSKTTIVYGSTEAEPISEIDGASLSTQNPSHEMGLCVGKVVPEAEVAIVPITEEPIHLRNDTELRELSLPKGEVGEIIVRGNHVLREYFNNPEALRLNKIFYDGVCWHRTGDSGFIGTDGQLYLTGRASLVFHHQGNWIYPFIQEYIIQQIPGVKIGTLIQWNQEIIYFVELEQNADVQKITNELEGLEARPARIIWGKIPRDKRHNTKIDYQKMMSNFSA